MRSLTGFLCLVVLLLGCGGETPASDATSSDHSADGQPLSEQPPAEPAGDSYSVRGKVVRVSKARRELTIRHESIPDFIDPTGAAEEMHAMEMTFATGDALDLSLAEEGAAIHFTLVVDWQARPSAVVTDFERLPADVELELGAH